MAAVVFPQEAVVEYVGRLLCISEKAMCEASILTRQAASLIKGGRHGNVMGILRKHAAELEQIGTAEILEIVADMEGFVEPDDLKRKKRAQAETAARDQEWSEKEEADEKAAWEPGGAHWTAARDQMMADAHALIYAAKTIGDSDDERLTRALREYCESEEREHLFKRLAENLKPPPEVSPAPRKRRARTRPHARGSTVIEGPWAS